MQNDQKINVKPLTQDEENWIMDVVIVNTRNTLMRNRCVNS